MDRKIRFLPTNRKQTNRDTASNRIASSSKESCLMSRKEYSRNLLDCDERNQLTIQLQVQYLERCQSATRNTGHSPADRRGSLAELDKANLGFCSVKFVD